MSIYPVCPECHCVMLEKSGRAIQSDPDVLVVKVTFYCPMGHKDIVISIDFDFREGIEGG